MSTPLPPASERLLPQEFLEQERRIEGFVSKTLDLILSCDLTWDEVVESFGLTSKVLAMTCKDGFSKFEAEAKLRFSAGISRPIDGPCPATSKSNLH